MNWKKNGYSIGDTVFLVGEFMFTSKRIYSNGTVIHSGTKILKVKMDDNTVLKFQNKGASSGGWGIYYSVFKSKEEYDDLIALKEARNDMLESLNDILQDLSLDQLKDVEKLLNSFNKGKSNE